jgi:hypothetical protein
VTDKMTALIPTPGELAEDGSSFGTMPMGKPTPSSTGEATKTFLGVKLSRRVSIRENEARVSAFSAPSHDIPSTKT